jgi:hypothetical protein
VGFHGGFINGVMDEFSMVYWWGYEWGLGHFMSGFISGFFVIIFHFVWVLNEFFSCCVVQDGGVMGEF